MLNSTDKLFLHLEEEGKEAGASEEAKAIYAQVVEIGPNTYPALNERFHERQVLIVAHLACLIRGDNS